MTRSASRERLLLTALVALVYSLYLPVGLWSATLTPHPVEVALDGATPFLPGWAFVYLLLYTMAALPLVVPFERLAFRRVVAAYLTIDLLSLLVFVLFPVHMTLRPDLAAEGSFAEWMMAQLYEVDRPSNCFPSLHVSTTILAALCVLKVDRVLGWGGLVVATAISASTMLVKQHYLADVLSGAALALAAWWLLVRPVRMERVPFSWRRVAPLALAQLGLFALLWALYLLGVDLR